MPIICRVLIGFVAAVLIVASIIIGETNKFERNRDKYTYSSPAPAPVEPVEMPEREKQPVIPAPTAPPEQPAYYQDV